MSEKVWAVVETVAPRAKSVTVIKISTRTGNTGGNVWIAGERPDGALVCEAKTRRPAPRELLNQQPGIRGCASEMCSIGRLRDEWPEISNAARGMCRKNVRDRPRSGLLQRRASVR